MHSMSSNHADSMIAVYFNVFLGTPPASANRSGLLDVEKSVLTRQDEFLKSRAGYFVIQSTKVHGFPALLNLEKEAHT